MKGFLFLLSIIICIITKAQVPVFEWAKQFASTSGVNGLSIIIDPSGNIYSSGFFYGTTDFDPGPGVFTLTAGSGMFVSKLDASGQFVWAKQISAIEVEGAALASDPLGNVYVTGYFQGTADFDPGPGTFNLNSSNISEDIFVLKLSPSGNFLWAKSMGSVTHDRGNSIAVDNAGNVYTTGLFTGTSDFDPGSGTFTLTSVGLKDVFVSKFDPAGNFISAFKLGGQNDDAGNSIAVDAVGNIYTTGFFEGIGNFNPGQGTVYLTSFGGPDIFISKLDASGNCIWAKNMGGFSTDKGYSLALDASGNVYSTGFFYATADFDPGPATYTLTSTTSSNIFVSKLDASGNFLWAKNLSGPSEGVGYSLAVDASANVYTTGYCDYYPAMGPVGGLLDILTTKLSASGSLLWSKIIGGSGLDMGYSIALDASANVYTTGRFANTVDFNPGAGSYTLTAGGGDAFIHKMSQCSAPPAPTNSTSASNQSICANYSTTLSVTSTGTVNWYASTTSTTVISTGTAYITAPLNAGTYTYYAEANTCTVSATRTPITVTVSLCTGITNNSIINQASVYPNPFSTEFKISGLSGFFNIYNTLGQLVLSNSFTDNESINTNKLVKGIYNLKVYTTTGTEVKTLTIIKD